MFTFRIFGCKGESEAARRLLAMRHIQRRASNWTRKGRCSTLNLCMILSENRFRFSGACTRWAGGLKRGVVPAVAGTNSRQAERLVSVNCWLVPLVQFSWLAEISRQLKLIGDWRISEVPLICTELAPVKM